MTQTTLKHDFDAIPVTEHTPVKSVLEYFAAKYTSINRDRLRALLFYTEWQYYTETQTRLTNTEYNATIDGFSSASIVTAFNKMECEHNSRRIYSNGDNTVIFTNITSSFKSNSIPVEIQSFIDAIHEHTKNTPTSTLTEHIEKTPVYSVTHIDTPVNFSELTQ